MFRFVATLPTNSEFTGGFDRREDAVKYGRMMWPILKRNGVQQIQVVDTCGDAEVLWRAPTPASEVPVGYYAVAGKRYHLDRPTEGRFADWTFVATGSDYHDRQTLASVRPDNSVSRPHAVLDAILADPFARAAEYGQITGTCAACGRKLEDPVSRQIGLGPICRQRWGV